MVTRAPPGDWISEHRRLWARKASLRLVYRAWFAELRAACVPQTSVVELGCGPGFLKEMYPEVLSTDVVPNPYVDQIVDATALPFADGTVGNFVLLDVFHHLPRPQEFLREAARALRRGGRLVMLEPWVGLAGRVLYRYVHHEDCDLIVDPAAPWSGAHKDAMAGNAALPYLYFRPGGYLERSGLPLRVLRREALAALPWLLSGGFQPFSLLPPRALAAAAAFDRLLSRFPRLTATRCVVVLERT
jgi:SAM-dependent methyltransferase